MVYFVKYKKSDSRKKSQIVPLKFRKNDCMRVAFFSAKSFDRYYFERFNGQNHEIVFFEAPLRKATTNLAQGFECICVFVNDEVDAEVIQQLANQGVKLIALRCAGFNNVDLDACNKYDITVVRVPKYSPEAVAEHAVALILTLNRKTHKSYNRVREHNFALENLEGFDLNGKTVGVIGTGYIGRIFCKIMLGFGCRILACDPNPSDDLKNTGVHYVDLDQLLSESHIISLHCPLSTKTHHLIDKTAFGKMRDGVMLINTSRGALINSKNAISALKSGRLGYLGIDVYEQEDNLFFIDLSDSIIQDDVITRLMTFPNVLVTAHQGFFTREALEEITTTTLSNISAFENGEHIQNEVTILT